ncbi:MAG: hypothetical protein QXU98_05805 [Candidatus Parvarchaeota archaeon]
MNATVGDLVFTVVVIAFAAVILFSFVIVITRVILKPFSPKETASIALVSFMMGIMMEAYWVGATEAEAIAAIIVLIFTGWLAYRMIKGGWRYYQSRAQEQEGKI